MIKNYKYFCRYCIILVFAFICTFISPSLASLSPVGIADTPQILVDKSRTLYESGRFLEAIEQLQNAAQEYQIQDNTIGQSIALSNLSLVYQQIGEWAKAKDAIALSLSLLKNYPQESAVFAQALDVQGKLQLAQGQSEQAIDTWKQASEIYKQLQDVSGITQNIIHQAKALQALGLYRQASLILENLTQSLAAQPDSLMKVLALRNLGDSLRATGNFEKAQTILQQSLEIAQRLQRPEAIAATQLSLGNIAYAQGNSTEALQRYQQAATGSPLTQVEAHLNQLRIFIDTKQPIAVDLLPKIQSELDQLPPSRAVLYAQVNFSQNWLKLILQGENNTPNPTDLKKIAQRLAIARQQAQQLGDPRVESLVLGNLGALYEKTHQWSEAQKLTEQAITLSQPLNQSDINYLWAWQLGRILRAQGQAEKAIGAYNNAVSTLKALRSDLVVNPEQQFLFRESVEPIYRQLVELLLRPEIEPSQEALVQARDTIESLQLAELDNFFRQACLNTVQAEDIDQQAAIVYPIILNDRLEIILSPPKLSQSSSSPALLRHYTVPISQTQIERTAKQLLQVLKQENANRQVLPIAQELYNGLIRPFEADLAANANVKTLVFVLDGILRNVPVAVLHDGTQYLVEKYAVALTPGLTLLSSQVLQRQAPSALLAGISQSRDGFPALENVDIELQKIQQQVRGQELLNQKFTEENLKAAIGNAPYPIVHLATHGNFSSRLEETFLLTWDKRLNINQLNQLLQSSDLSRRRPIELLVLSACETARGDDRATLGLAGIAVRAGARSTIASLWKVNDAATSQLMVNLYQRLANRSQTKAESLRQAQISMLTGTNPRYQQPYFWSAFVLVGNWQ